MSTSYYHRTNCCDKCDRYDERHIGKRLLGWQFNFQGYNSPYLRSFKAWIRELKATGKIFNEYGEEVSLEEFVKMVECKSCHTKNHYDYCLEQKYNMENDWKDEEGYAFTSVEFS